MRFLSFCSDVKSTMNSNGIFLCTKILLSVGYMSTYHDKFGFQAKSEEIVYLHLTEYKCQYLIQPKRCIKKMNERPETMHSGWITKLSKLISCHTSGLLAMQPHSHTSLPSTWMIDEEECCSDISPTISEWRMVVAFHRY